MKKRVLGLLAIFLIGPSLVELIWFSFPQYFYDVKCVRFEAVVLKDVQFRICVYRGSVKIQGEHVYKIKVHQDYLVIFERSCLGELCFPKDITHISTRGYVQVKYYRFRKFSLW